MFARVSRDTFEVEVPAVCSCRVVGVGVGLLSSQVKPSLREQYSQSLEQRAQDLEKIRRIFEANFRHKIKAGWKVGGEEAVCVCVCVCARARAC